MNKLTTRDQTTEFLLYTAPNGGIKVEVLLSNETIWLTQKRMAELFGVGVAAISKHLDNIYESGELQRVLPHWCLPPDTAWAVFGGRKLLPTKTRAFIEMLSAALGGESSACP